MQKIKSFIKARTKIQIGIFALILIVAVFVFTGGDNPKTESIVERGIVEQEVAATGKVRSASEVNLGFERSGKVIKVNALVGDAVQIGDTLVVLDQSDLLADIKKANASLNDALINLSKANRTSYSDYSNAYSKLYVALTDAYTDARDSILNTADRFFWSPSSSSPKLEISHVSNGNDVKFYVDDTLARNISVDRGRLNDIFVAWDLSISNAKTSSSGLDDELALTEKNINEVKNFLADLAYILNTIKGYDQSYESIIAGYKTSVATARTTLNTSLSELLATKSSYLDAPRELSQGSGFDAVLQEESKVEAARADIESLESELSKTILRSPIAGIVTKQDAKVGEIVTSGMQTTSVVADKNLEIVADISEINIGKIEAGKGVSITLDAFPGEVIQGQVLYVEPGDKLVDGVVNYEVKVAFVGAVPNNIKTGLTSSLAISTERKVDVLRIPAFAVERRSGKRFVIVRTDTGEEEREIQVGILGKDGFVEVISGLSEGEVVLSSQK